MEVTTEDSYIITGGKKLRGTVHLSGAKNVALKVIIGALLFDGKVILHNIPQIQDVKELLHLIQLMGGDAKFISKNTVSIDASHLRNEKVDLLHGSKIRVSFMLFAPLLHRFQRAHIPNPGGCRIGARPIDRSVEGMKALGTEVSYDSNTGYYEAVQKKQPFGSYTFEKPSHTSTELLLLLASGSPHEVVLHNSAQEPEIDDLIHFLRDGGAVVNREGTSIRIRGKSHLHQNKPYTIMSDRNEAATFISLALSTGGEVTVGPIQEHLLHALIDKLKEAHVSVESRPDLYWFFSRKNGLSAVDVETNSYPGFMTDWQPPWAMLMTQATGNSVIHERVFENRFAYVEELRKLGAKIEMISIPVKNPSDYYFFNYDASKVCNQAIQITGPVKLHNGALTVSDLRAGATLVTAALVATGESVVSGVSIIERGYENFVEKVRGLGGEIEKV